MLLTLEDITSIIIIIDSTIETDFNGLDSSITTWMTSLAEAMSGRLDSKSQNSLLQMTAIIMGRV